MGGQAHAREKEQKASGLFLLFLYKQYSFDLQPKGMFNSNQSTNQSINQSINEAINQSIQFVRCVLTCYSPQPVVPGIRGPLPSSPRIQPEPPYQGWS